MRAIRFIKVTDTFTAVQFRIIQQYFSYAFLIILEVEWEPIGEKICRASSQPLIELDFMTFWLRRAIL